VRVPLPLFTKLPLSERLPEKTVLLPWLIVRVPPPKVTLPPVPLKELKVCVPPFRSNVPGAVNESNAAELKDPATVSSRFPSRIVPLLTDMVPVISTVPFRAKIPAPSFVIP
jgi:hypothetical protein